MYYDALAKIEIDDGTFDTTMFRREKTQVAYTEKVYNTYVLPVSSGAVTINMGGVSAASLVFIENSSATIPLYYKLNAGTEYVITDGWVMIRGGVVTAITVENKSATDTLTARVAVLG